MKLWSILALAASVAAIPFEGTQLHKRNGERIYVGYRVVSKVRTIENSLICPCCTIENVEILN